MRIKLPLWKIKELIVFPLLIKFVFPEVRGEYFKIFFAACFILFWALGSKCENAHQISSNVPTIQPEFTQVLLNPRESTWIFNGGMHVCNTDTARQSPLSPPKKSFLGHSYYSSPTNLPFLISFAIHLCSRQNFFQDFIGINFGSTERYLVFPSLHLSLLGSNYCSKQLPRYSKY